MSYGFGLFEETLENLTDRKFDLLWTGDCSYCYSIILNQGIKRGGDWGRKLALRCGGTTHLCDMWVSTALPYYAIDTYSMAYNPKLKQYEFKPFRPSKKRDAQLVKTLTNIPKLHGFKKISKRVSKLRVPKAITDCREKGEATVFNCLFSDTQCYTETIRRISDEPLPGVLKGTKVSSQECLTPSGKIIEKYHSYRVESGDYVRIHLDKQNRITKVEVEQGKDFSERKTLKVR